ncbi:MAG: HlyD family efflux transporter periplasmic adaptor subunit [Dehalococcoidales bacterium]|nr:HlyD family efflux transporter periplasmic adaptor subunit [Dehalococcoidales bacterium]
MKLKLTQIAAILLIFGGIAFLSTGCIGSSGSSASVQALTYTVQPGSISIFVTGTGNLALKNKQELTFGQTGLVSQASYAKISDVLVTEGMFVEQGNVLVKADPKDWQDQIVSDQHALDSAQYNLSQANSGVAQAETALMKTQNNVAQAQTSVSDARNKVVAAQSALDSARYALSMQEDIKELQDKIADANIQLQQAKMMLQSANRQQDVGSAQYWRKMIQYYEEDTNPDSTSSRHVPDGGLIGVYTSQMNSLLADPEHAGVTSSVADIQARVVAVQQAEDNLLVIQQYVVNAQNEVLYAQNIVQSARNDLELANNAVIIARNKVDEARKALDDDKNSSQEITAPFRGLITLVNVNKGDIVQRSANLIEIAEPDTFEANIMVTQRDVVSIKIGNDAIVTVDAVPGLEYPARITRIAPLATIQSGVVNYKITVELTSTKPVSANDLPAAETTPVELKDGFSVVANIPVQKKDNILIVPSKAVSHMGQDYVVQVETAASLETRIVKIGITDFQNTEIIEGLIQGDLVVLPVIPTAAPPNSGGIFGGG